MRNRKRPARLCVLVTATLLSTMSSCGRPPRYPSDDARAAGLTAADLPQVADDVFREMDGGIQLSEEEIKGRNTWILWTAGNQAFWDRVAREGYGTVDLLKTLDSRQRPRRFALMGLVNEPGFRKADRPGAYGLWLDEPVEPTSPRVDEKVYGRSSGVIGFRIYSNPDFGETARRSWDPDRYYNDRSYFEDPKLVRPYRVGVTCGLCHVAPHPLHPPDDVENPRWENLASAIGNQYFREGRVFAPSLPTGSFLKEMLDAQPAGTSDTSRLANDHINNPSAINPIFALGARLAIAVEERMGAGALDLPGGEPRRVPHVLKDGADSVGVAGAVMRVYVSEGLYGQQWLTDHDLLLGLRPQRPFSVAAAARYSVYWQATMDRVDNIARFFARIAPMHLEDAPGGRAHITTNRATMERGRIVFADHCATCHSSKQPPASVEPGTAAARQWHRKSVMRPDFRDGNFLSTDRRYSVTRVKTNACRALATNATRGHVWDNFSSETYKTLESAGTIEAFDPADPSRPYPFKAPANGPGYYRVPSLVSLWSSAPFLHNNSVGAFTGDPSVAGRIRAFDDAIEKLLWPERRAGPASIWVTGQASFIRVPEALVPSALRPLCRDRVLEIGPIPPGMPINLVANVEANLDTLVMLIPTVRTILAGPGLRRFDLLDRVPEPTTDRTLKALVAALMKASTCPDLIEDRGHLFGTSLPDGDKRALIEFLKTL